MLIDEEMLSRHIAITEQEIAVAVERLAERILDDSPAGAELLIIGILEGARPFVKDLATALIARNAGRIASVDVDWLRASSYHGGIASSGTVQLLEQPRTSLTARHVVIVDDIIDEGHTLAAVVAALRQSRPATMRVCVLLDKPNARTRAILPEYIGFTAPDAFIVGYGLDYQENYRHLPYLAALPTSALE